MQDPALWARIERYDFPQGFEQKLAAQFGGWSHVTNTLRDEYRRFVYLAIVSPDEVTPSESIDRVWHLHLTYTRDYWDRFCAQVLQQEFHHTPCDGPESMPRYADQYAKTRALYEQEFGTMPPKKVWPIKGNWKPVLVGSIIGLVGVALIALTALEDDTGDLSIRAILGVVLLLAGGLYAAFNLPYGKTAAGGCGGGSAGCGGGGCGGG